MKWTPKRGNVQEQEQIEIIATEKDFGDTQKEEIVEENIGRKAWVTLLFGDTATGKTFVSQTFPSPIIVLDTEFGRSRDVKNRHYRTKDIKIIESLQYETVKFRGTDVFDDFPTVDFLWEQLDGYIEKVKNKELKLGTVIFDSISDLWSFIQGWTRILLSKQLTRSGIPRADPLLMQINNQMDYKIANDKHKNFERAFYELTKLGIHVVLTAREKDTPDYVKETRPVDFKKPITEMDYISSQKWFPNKADNIFRLMKTERGGKVVYNAKCLKILAGETPVSQIEDLTYEKIKKLVEGHQNVKKLVETGEV